MSPMTDEQRDSFLAEPRVAVLGIGRGDTGPLLAPIWYRYEQGAFLLCMSGSSAKARRLAAAGRATLCVQAEDYPYRYVVAEGPVSLRELGPQTHPVSLRELGPQTHPVIRALASRYLGDDAGLRYADSFAAADEILVTLTPARLQAEVPGR